MTDQEKRWASAKAYVDQRAAMRDARRREIARLPIGEKFRILEELHEAEAQIAEIRAAMKKKTPTSS